MPSDQDAAPIEGTRDLLQPVLARSQQLRTQLQDFLALRGYAAIELPVLERTSLYLRKLGSRVAASMFSLTDQRGDRLSLRPELTASAIRAFLAQRDGLPHPVRWQYCGPVFRDREGTGRPRQFTQLGAELIGASSRRADAELLALACAGLQAAGLARPRLVLGHAGLIPDLLEQLPLAERSRMFLAGRLELLRKGEAGLAELREGLKERQVLAPDGEAWPASSETADSDEAANLVSWLLSEGATRSTGRRSAEQIVRRFRTKMHGPEDPSQLERALGLAVEIAAVRAPPAAALQQGQRVLARQSLASGPLAELEAIVSLLDAHGLGIDLEVDLGLTRALGYYTGIVFEIYSGVDAPSPIAGGGRYDGLVRALGGGADVPALGFAYTLEDLETVLPKTVGGAPAPAAVLVVVEEDSAMGAAARYMDSLRDRGESCVLEVLDRGRGDRLRYCRQAGIARIAVVRTDGVEEVPAAGEPALTPAGTS